MLRELLSQVKTVAIGGHIRPDGDCAGSCLGLYQYIKEQEPQIEADLYLEEMADSFAFMESSDEILHEAKEEKIYDLLLRWTAAMRAGSVFQNRCLKRQRKHFVLIIISATVHLRMRISLIRMQVRPQRWFTENCQKIKSQKALQSACILELYMIRESFSIPAHLRRRWRLRRN